MAVLKAISGPPKTHGGLRNTIEYVLRKDKVKDGYMDMTGPAPETLTWDSVYRSFREEKEIWNKDSGRMCVHYVISFHKDEKITPEEVLTFGQEFAEKAFPGHQVLMAVHQDRGHLHLHMVSNTVSYEDGHKLHTTTKDLADMKEAVNQMCRDRGLTVAEKGKHFDGSRMEEGEGIAWNQKKYRAMSSEKKPSYLVECFQAVMEAKEKAVSRDTFITAMEQSGWNVHWSDKRKHITFENKDHQKVRDSNLSKTFTVNISKEALQNELQNQAERQQREELAAYYRQLQDSISGSAPEDAVSKDYPVGAGNCKKDRPDQRTGRPAQRTIQGHIHGGPQRSVRPVKRSHKQDYDFER
ncbi:relaxase/mobilization nuclease domain-containing protein [uncultured Acidaminococcus sp.]|uniref:relaxase/mobilization nuclease domain-containing protein n=1 Tax=uncultured Acidaminococcus sp. TaxID=352152 RepID=UPI00259075E2|nr:relaxase/mobilization nuclease domain-containing protein [uncultured Acidaminococcus sp.]